MMPGHRNLVFTCLERRDFIPLQKMIVRLTLPTYCKGPYVFFTFLIYETALTSEHNIFICLYSLYYQYLNYQFAKDFNSRKGALCHVKPVIFLNNNLNTHTLSFTDLNFLLQVVFSNQRPSNLQKLRLKMS